MIEISTDKTKLQISVIHQFLTETYWAKGRTIGEVKTSIQHSFCFGVYLDNKQIGFARVATDYVVFAYIMDVFILPKYRGSSPLVWQLINGEERIGSSLFKFAKGMDDGDILHQVSFKNSSKYTIKTATHKLQQLWDECLSDIWKGFIEEVIMPFKQEHSLATFCAKRKDEDGILDWSLDSNFLELFCRFIPIASGSCSRIKIRFLLDAARSASELNSPLSRFTSGCDNMPCNRHKSSLNV